MPSSVWALKVNLRRPNSRSKATQANWERLPRRESGLSLAVTLQPRDQRPQEYLIEPQLTRRRHLLHQGRADPQDSYRAVGSNGGCPFRAPHVAGLSETGAILQHAQAIAIGLNLRLSGYDDVETIIHLAFANDVFPVLVIVPVTGAQHFPDFGV